MENINEELMAKARGAKSAEELLALAKENDVELTEEQANAYFDQMNKTGELSDDELDSVAGGGCGKSKDYQVAENGHCNNYICMTCLTRGCTNLEHLKRIKPSVYNRFCCRACGYWHTGPGGAWTFYCREVDEASYEGSFLRKL